MKLHITIILLTLSAIAQADLHDHTDAYFKELEAAQANYRKGFSEALFQCDQVYLYIVDFDDIDDSHGPFGRNSEGRIKIARYGPNHSTKILQAKELSDEERIRVLSVLSSQIAVETHHGGAFCHFPIHGIKAYCGDRLLLESTFCWACGNFGFEYPEGTQWLDTSETMEQTFKDILPIPKSEIKRFKKKHPSALK